MGILKIFFRVIIGPTIFSPQVIGLVRILYCVNFRSESKIELKRAESLTNIIGLVAGADGGVVLRRLLVVLELAFGHLVIQTRLDSVWLQWREGILNCFKSYNDRRLAIGHLVNQTKVKSCGE